MREIPGSEFIPASNRGQLEEYLLTTSQNQIEIPAKTTSVFSGASPPSFRDVVASTQKDLVPNSWQGSQEETFPTSPSSWEEESVIPLSSTQQTDLEDLFIKSAFKDAEEDPNRFRITTIINGILPCDQITNAPVGLDRLLVAFCYQCKSLLKYDDFRGSTSPFVFRKHWKFNSEQDETRKFFNYLCSEEDHDRNMEELINNDNADLSRYENDENVFLDKTFMFTCPSCKLQGLPDALCRVEPTFIFQLHLTNLTNQTNNESCLHVKAFGIHAEYFLGTKADHVLRSPEVWKRAESRLVKLAESRVPIVLNLRKNSNPPYEVHLEDTFVVYGSYHILPFL